ncbi:hypothetical protein RIR_jg27287.t1 [Rhizophagus irregularis DAOM 181602=DAOM 197198]|nr:hypothetical protein RIR_jg27287.t1 [Rhizophagus irregularis DAOM 181602=DAOM 197198]CAG8583616.1 6745_t:CDS:2 [Rhizophagus irregularis]
MIPFDAIALNTNATISSQSSSPSPSEECWFLSSPLSQIIPECNPRSVGFLIIFGQKKFKYKESNDMLHPGFNNVMQLRSKLIPPLNAERVRISFADDVEEDICIIDLIQPAMVSDAANE